MFTTARKFKGLEADVVIIVDIDAKTFEDEESKGLFYVGASRAKHYLDIIYVGDKDDLQNMVKNISDWYYPTPTIGIALSLNVKPISDQINKFNGRV